MYPYVAFLHDTRTLNGGDSIRSLVDQFRRTHPLWKSVDGGKGLSVFHSPPPGRSVEAYELPGANGVVFGTLFPKDLTTSPGNWNLAIDESLAGEFVRTRGRHLVNHYWGAYIALLNDHGAAHYILRDCSGKIPCYAITHGAVTIIASNVEDLFGLELPRFSINARYIAGFIYDAELSQNECGLNEVEEILAGECLELSGSRARRFPLWDPRSICREHAIENFEEASGQVRQVTQACVDFWASKYDRIVHRLSGGLDSSVILGCLARSAYRPLVTCLHLESGGADDNEREFAQLAAADAGMELVVQSGYSQGARYDDRVFRLPRAPKPSVANLGITLESNLRNLVPAQAKAEAIWDGEGGDHIFFAPRTPFGAVDYAFSRGMAGDFSRCLRDAVRRSRLSYWAVLERSIRLGLFGGRWHPKDEQPKDAMFLNPEIAPVNIAEYVWQPWLGDASDLPPGKRWQICLLAHLLHRHRPVPELQYASEHHPLFSQPLVELCLRIPLYTLLCGGTNRALERAAFGDCVPGKIIRRENKGTVAIALMGKMREGLPYLRDLVLDGVLVQERIIERSALVPYLAGNRPIHPQAFWPFMSCIAAEVWARKWAMAAWRI